VSAGSPWASLNDAVRTLEQVSMTPLAPPLRLAEAAGVLSLATDLAMGHTEQTIDSGRFTRQPGQTLPMAEPPDVQDAVALVRAILLDDPAP
jgi:hypothetical protein